MIKPPKSDAAWTWGPAQQGSFEKLKAVVTSARVLAYYDAQKPTIISDDSSSYGLDAVLHQENKDGYRPVAFASRTFDDADTW